MTAVLAMSKKNHAMTNHDHANPKRRSVQAAVSTMYTHLWACHPQQVTSNKSHLHMPDDHNNWKQMSPTSSAHPKPNKYLELS